ncbi:MAG: DUF2958 domain-containing protein [Acidimicrobiales bacterium]
MSTAAARNRGHKLMPAELEAKLPPLYATEAVAPDEKPVVVKLFSPYTNWRWYVVEGERHDGDLVMFGFVTSPNCPEGEWGYVSLDELEALTAMAGQLPLVERDLHWAGKTISDRP